MIRALHTVYDAAGSPHTGPDLLRLMYRVARRNQLLHTVAAALALASPEPSPPHTPATVEPRRCSTASAA